MRLIVTVLLLKRQLMQRNLAVEPLTKTWRCRMGCERVVMESHEYSR